MNDTWFKDWYCSKKKPWNLEVWKANRDTIMDPEPRCLERVGNVKSQEVHALGDVTAPNGVV